MRYRSYFTGSFIDNQASSKILSDKILELQMCLYVFYHGENFLQDAIMPVSLNLPSTFLK